MGSIAILGPRHSTHAHPLHVPTCRPPSNTGIRVRCACRYSFPTPYPYSRGTLPLARLVQELVRIPMPHPNADGHSPPIENQMLRPGPVFFFSSATCCVYTRHSDQSIAVYKSIRNCSTSSTQAMQKTMTKPKRGEHARVQRNGTT